MRQSIKLLSTALVAALLLAACGGDDDDTSTSSTTSTSEVAPADDDSTEDSDDEIDDIDDDSGDDSDDESTGDVDSIVLTLDDLPDGFTEVADDGDDDSDDDFCGQSTAVTEEGRVADIEKEFEDPAAGVALQSSVDEFQDAAAASASLQAAVSIIEGCDGYTEDGATWSVAPLDIAIVDEADGGVAATITVEGPGGTVTIDLAAVQSGPYLLFVTLTPSDGELVDSLLATMSDRT